MRHTVSSLICVLSVVAGVAEAAAGAVRPPKPLVAAAMEDKRAKLSSDLRELVRVYRSAGEAAAHAFAAEQRISLSARDSVQVVVQTTRDEVAAIRNRLPSIGAHFEGAATDLVLARVPVPALEPLASMAAVKVVRRPSAPVLFQTTSEGVNVTGAMPWHAAGRKGRGVKVAILDVGFDGYESLMGSELPEIPAARVRSFSGDISGGGEEHGTGVAEVVHDVAPEADLYLVNFSNEVELENAVQWLIEQRVDVINTSWGFPCGGPLNGTGWMNDLVKRAADAGIVWVAAAGNFAQQHWSASFADSNGDSWHNFSPTEEGNTVHMDAGDELRVCVEWDDWTARDHDLDLYVWDGDGNVVESSTDDQSGPDTHDPVERLEFTAGTSGNYYIGVKRYSGTRNPRVHLFAYPPGAECAIESVANADSTSKGLLGELRQFRDTVLARSPYGKTLIESYYRHSAEVRRVLLLHPRRALEAAAILRASRPAVRSVIDRTEHSGFVVSQDYATRVDRFLEQLGTLVSPALREELAAFRVRASLSTAGGQTAAQYWESLLGPDPSDAGLERQTFPDSGYMLHTVAETSLTPPADSQHAFTIGAFDWSTGALEDFSSRGPTADGRRKPDLAAPDGVCTTTYGDCGAHGFRGTSAAAPHAAGAVALVRQAYPAFTLSALRSFLTSRAVDLAPNGPDNRSGAGRLTLGSTSEVDLLPAPALLHPAGERAPLRPTYTWSEVSGAASYRLMIAASLAALPADPAATTCSGCLLTTTTSNTYFTPPITLLAASTYYWQVQALATGKRGSWAQTSFTTGLAPEQRPPERADLTEETGRWPAPASRSVVITHGYSSNVQGWVKELAQQICDNLGEPRLTSPLPPNTLTKACQARGWDVWVMDWSEQARLAVMPWGAFTSAIALGEMVASSLKTKNYEHIHFIAHSAGANLIDFATIQTRYWVIKEQRPPLTVQNTFLDAYEPSGDVSRYGRNATWADNYVDTRRVDLHSGFDGTRLFLQHAYNVDVTGTSVLDCWALCRHSRPYRFYGESVNTGFVGNQSDAEDDPVLNTGGMGYALSTENGISVHSLASDYPAGSKCVMKGDICETEESAVATSTSWVARATPVVNSVSGTVNYGTGATSLFNFLRLGIVPVSTASPLAPERILAATSPTEPPSWIVVDVSTTEPVNELRFHWRFGTGGEGLLRVFVNGELVRELDQRYVPATSAEPEAIYVGGAAGTLPAGAHRLVFRLDGFGAGASGVELTGVALGRTAPATRRRTVRH